MKFHIALCLLLAAASASCGLLPASTALLRASPFLPAAPVGSNFHYSTVEYAPVAAAPLQVRYTSPLLAQHLQLLQQISPIYQTPVFGQNPVLTNPILQNPIYQTPIFGGQQPVADVPAAQPPAPAQTPVAGTPLDEDTVAVDAAV